MESSPRGPLICTVDMACARAPLPRADGGMTLNVTPGGMDSGAEPILDWHGEVVAKFLQAMGAWKAGKRKLGNESDAWYDAAAILRAQRRRAGANIVGCLIAVESATFLEAATSARSA